MDKDDKVMRDMFLNNYGIFRSYERMSVNPDKNDLEAEEKLFWRLEVMYVANYLYDIVKTNGASILSKPERFGLDGAELKKKLESIDEIMMDLCAERECYYPSLIN